MGMDVNHKPKVRGQIAADLSPQVAGVVAAHYIPVFLHVQHVRTRGVQRDAVNAVAHLGVGIGNVWGLQSLVDRFPGGAAIVSAEKAPADEMAM